MINWVLHDGYIALSNDGDQEVHKHDWEQNDIQKDEDDPNQAYHIMRCLRVFSPCFIPDWILRSDNITDWISNGLEQEKCEGSDVGIFLISVMIVISGSENLVDARDTKDEQALEDEETGDLSNTGKCQLH